MASARAGMMGPPSNSPSPPLSAPMKITIGIPVRRLALLGAVLVLAAVNLCAAPANVIIRLPAGAALPASLTPLLTQWRQSGQVVRVLLLTDGRSEKAERTAKFGALAVLEFSDENSADAWQRDAAPALSGGLIVRRADILVHAESSPRDPGHPVFVVNTYTPLVSAARFAEYVEGYVKPLYEAMRDTGHLVRYTAYLERGEKGKADALNVLEYRDRASFTIMGTLKTGIRDRLMATHPTYAQFDKIKDTLRLDGFGTAATRTELPPPGR